MSNSLSDTIIQLIGGLQNVDFNILWLGFIGYLVFMWTIASVWVFFDARKRYNSIFIIIAITIFVAICNIPALVLYVMMRPEYTKDELEQIQEGIVNIFIRNGKLLAAPDSPADVSEHETIAIKKDSQKIITNDFKAVVPPAPIKNENNEIEISYSFLQSLQESFGIIYYTIATFYQNVLKYFHGVLKYITSIKIELPKKHEVQVNISKEVEITPLVDNISDINTDKFESTESSNTSSKKSKKSSLNQKSKISKANKELLKKELEFKPTRKKIPPVKFVLK